MNELQFLASTYRGENCDWQYDTLCECLLCGDAQGNQVVADDSRLAVKLFLDVCWMNVHVKHWLLSKNGYRSDTVNETKFIYLIGWMFDHGMFLPDLTKRELARFVFECLPLDRYSSRHSIVVTLSMPITQLHVLSILEQKWALHRG